jgi:hypothetical protein
MTQRGLHTYTKRIPSFSIIRDFSASDTELFSELPIHRGHKAHASLMRNTVLCDVMSCNSAEVHRRFGATHFLHHWNRIVRRAQQAAISLVTCLA